MSLLRILPLLLVSVRQEENFQIRTGVDIVLFDTSVSSRTNVPVPNLRATDFRVFVDNKPAPLIHFAAQDSQVAIAFLVDASGSMRPLRNITSAAAQLLFNLNRQGDEASLIAFADLPKVLIGPVPRPVAQAKALEEALLEKAAWAGRTSLYDALLIGIKGLGSATSSRRALVLFSDGGDNQSKATKAEVVRAIRSQSLTVYAIALIEQDSPDLDESFLRQISSESGGRYFRVTDPATLPIVQKSIAADIRGRYVLGVNARPFETAKNAKHSIRIESRDAQGTKFKILARPNYYSREATQ